MSAPAQSSPWQANIDAVNAANAKAEEEAAAQRRRAELMALRNPAVDAARNDANAFFTQRGVDPTMYAGDIEKELQSLLSGIPVDDPAPGQYFQGASENIWDTLTSNFREKNLGNVNKIFSPNYDVSRIDSGSDDAFLQSIEDSQFADATSLIENMLGRGVITDVGAGAARNALDRQRPMARDTLRTIGAETLGSGQQKLKDIANRARSDASTLGLGQNFDINSYASEAESAFNDFMNNLETSLKSRVPGNLFDTTGLASIAGAASGAQNTIFDPNALLGRPPGEKKEEDTEDENTNSGASIF